MPDRLVIEEALLRLVELVKPSAYKAPSVDQVSVDHLDLVGDTKAFMATNYDRRLSLNDIGGLADIAVAVGFSSHSHLTQAFRRAFGNTPSRYRRQPEAAVVAVAVTT